MKLFIRAAGTIKNSPERALIDDYISRAERLARAHGISAIDEIELELKNAPDKAAQTRAIVEPRDDGAVQIILDERGKPWKSEDMARQIRNWRADNRSAVIFHIGAADGFDSQSLPPGVLKYSFGAAVWPHKLVRVMLAEQIYRALSILSGTPYHRE